MASANASYIMLYCTGMFLAPPVLGFGLDIAPAGLFVGLAILLGCYFSLALWRICGGLGTPKPL